MTPIDTVSCREVALAGARNESWLSWVCNAFECSRRRVEKTSLGQVLAPSVEVLVVHSSHIYTSIAFYLDTAIIHDASSLQPCQNLRKALVLLLGLLLGLLDELPVSRVSIFGSDGRNFAGCPPSMSDVVHVLDEVLLVLAAGVDGRSIGLLGAASGREESTAESSSEGSHGKLDKAAR
jgi:hypothetical protein